MDRKLVKQTVMTSVYGVTFVGAREQIKRRLEEKGHITDDRVLFSAACYAAKVSYYFLIATMRSLFEGIITALNSHFYSGNKAKTFLIVRKNSLCS